jgi:hypothetical protein
MSCDTDNLLAEPEGKTEVAMTEGREMDARSRQMIT